MLPLRRPASLRRRKPDANPDAEGTEDDSDPDVEIVEKQFDEASGKKRNYTGYHTYRVIKEWATGPIPCWRMPKSNMKSILR